MTEPTIFFEDLRPAPETGPPPEDVPVAREVVERATASTVHILATGCGRYEGSGFAIAEDTIVTNAHVVAGADEVVIQRPDGQQREGTVVIFDPDVDLAILQVPGLGQEPLPLAPHDISTEGVTIGYPGGQPTPRVAAMRIEDRRAALGRDIYGSSPTERLVLFLATELQRGDSGSPVIDAEGRVGGIVFAISPDRRTLAYALDLEELEAVLEQPRQPEETGACI
jgi:S1-C subfamily serine protease